MNEQTINLIKSWVKVFLAAFLAVILSSLTAGVPIKVTDALIAGAVTLLPIVINWLDPKFPMYGKNFTPTKE